MKRIITILLLLIMAGQATRMVCSHSTELKLVQDSDDKKDNGGKADSKEGKESVLQAVSFRLLLMYKTGFPSAPVFIAASPVIDHLTPPPDTVCFW